MRSNRRCRGATPHRFFCIALASAALGGAWGCASNRGNDSSGKEPATGADGSSSGGSGATGAEAGGSQGAGSSSGTSRGSSSDSGGAVSDAGAQSEDASLHDGSTEDAGGDGACVPNLKCKPVPPDSGNYYADCVAQVNAFRACVCEPPLKSWDAGESCANQEAQYDDQADAAHAGFIASICSPEGNGECECPGYPSEPSIISECLQQMFDEGPPDSGYNHFSIMTASTATMVACGIYTDSKGHVWALQNYQE
jgi:hypothetical protein